VQVLVLYQVLVAGELPLAQVTAVLSAQGVATIHMSLEVELVVVGFFAA